MLILPFTDVDAGRDDCELCPDCGQRFDDTVDPGCETCNDHFGYDKEPDWCNDRRFNAWDDDPSWAEEFGYA